MSKKLHIIYILLFVFTTNSLQSQKLIGEIKINRKEKNITNLSGKLNDSISFHFIINKIKGEKNYKSTMYFYNKNQRIKEFNPIYSKKKPKYLTYHSNNNVLTIIKDIEKSFVIYDFDYTTTRILSQEILLDTKTIFSHENTTFIIGKPQGPNVKIIKIKSSTEIHKMFVRSGNDKEKKLISELNEKNIDYINDSQHIVKGSIKTYKGFYNNKNLVIIKDIKKTSSVELFKIDLKGKITTKEFSVLNKIKSKNQNSFIKDNLLFVFNMQSEKAFLSIYDIETSKLQKRIEYRKKSFGLDNKKLIINGKKIEGDFKSERFFNNFFPKGTYYATPYIGINKSTDNKYIVQIGHVDKGTYKNTSAYNFWWNYPAFSLNYNLSSSTFSGVVSPIGVGMMVFNAMSDKKRKGNYFEFYLDKNLSKINQEQIPEYYSIDIKYYNNKLDNLMVLKNQFYIPLKKAVRFINFDKTNNTYLIYNVPKP